MTILAVIPEEAVIPAEAGISGREGTAGLAEVPAFAGMTEEA
jgi:hypothetical protein